MSIQYRPIEPDDIGRDVEVSQDATNWHTARLQEIEYRMGSNGLPLGIYKASGLPFMTYGRVAGAPNADDLIYADRLDDLGMHEAASVLRGDAPARPLRIQEGTQISIGDYTATVLAISLERRMQEPNLLIKLTCYPAAAVAYSPEPIPIERHIRDEYVRRLLQGVERSMFLPPGMSYFDASQSSVNDSTTQAVPSVDEVKRRYRESFGNLPSMTDATHSNLPSTTDATHTPDPQPD